MKAYVIKRYGKNVAFEAAELQQPKVGEDDVLIEIHAAGLNVLDAKIRNGEFKLLLPYKLPLVLGHDLAGVVVNVGANVKRFKVGDEVYARPADFHIGTFAEYIALNENDVAMKPNNVTMEEAASMPLVSLTAWQALVEKAKLTAGQKVFIQAGSGGVGTIAIQLAKQLGATVATTTSKTNFDLVKRLGADVVIDYKTEEAETILHDYDVVLNSQDTTALKKSLTVLKPNGKLISISGPPDPSFADEIGASWVVKLIMRLLSMSVRRRAKRLNVDYSFLFMKASGSQLSEITALVSAGKIKPIVDRVFPFSAINEAMAYVETGRAKGKVVINIK